MSVAVAIKTHAEDATRRDGEPRIPGPSKQRVRSHQGGDLEEPFSTRLLGLGCEATALNVREQQALCAQLLAQPAVLLPQVLEDALLAAVQPPGENRDQKLKLQGVHRPERTPVRLPEIDRRPRPCPPLILQNRSRFGSADFWHRTGTNRRTAVPCGPAR
jgi:hypothetical protein